MRRIAITTVLTLAPALQGCVPLPGPFIGTAADRAADRAASRAADRATDRAASRMMVPMYRAYAASLMAVYFWAGGFWLGYQDYQPGEWTMWEHKVDKHDNDGSEKNEFRPVKVEKAFLERTQDGSEWWRLKTFGNKPEDTAVFEALLAPDHASMLELLVKVGENPVSKVTFEQQDQPAQKPRPIQDDWISNHTVGEVHLASGTLSFDAKHVRFTAADGSGTVDLYLSKDVPGGLLKYEFTGGNGDKYTISMIDHGTGAKRELQDPDPGRNTAQ